LISKRPARLVQEVFAAIRNLDVDSSDALCIFFARCAAAVRSGSLGHWAA
jgi:hypothetical protein